MTDYQPIDLSLIAAPDVVETIEYETILADLKADFQTRYPEFSADTLESDPVIKLLETAAYRETILRQRVNDGARAVMLATATGSTLDTIGGDFELVREVIDPGDPDALPPIASTYETDDRFRFRIQLSWARTSTAGPDDAYLYHVVNADPRIPVVNNKAGVSIASPNPVEVEITIMSTDPTGIPDQDLLDVVTAALADRKVRPLTDQVTVAAATKVDYTVTATLEIYDGPDKAVVLQNSITSVTAFCAAQRLLGEPVTIDGLHKALRVDGVRKVNLTAPAADVATTSIEFPNATAITVTEAA